jgi:hypothetical protein
VFSDVPGTRAALGLGATAAKTLYVSTTGNDATAVVGDRDRPYLTLLAARAAAVSGQTIFVLPGTYVLNCQTNHNLAKDRVNWYFFPGARVEVTGSVVSGSGLDELSGLFDDGQYGFGLNLPTSYEVAGHGDFVFNLTGANNSTGGNAGIVNVTKASSEVTFACRSVQVLSDNDPTQTQGMIPVSQSAGRLTVHANLINHAGGGPLGAVWWSDGEQYIVADEIAATYTVAIAGPKTAIYNYLDPGATGNQWIRAGFIDGSVYQRGAAATARSWIICNQVKGAVRADFGRLYLFAQKIWTYGYGDYAIYNYGADIWLQADKVTVEPIPGAADGTSSSMAGGYFYAADGTSFIDVKQWEDLGISDFFAGGVVPNAAGAQPVIVGAGTHILHTQVMEVNTPTRAYSGANLSLVGVAGGTLRWRGRLQCSDPAANGFVISGPGVLVHEGGSVEVAGTYRFYAASAKTVTCEASVLTNKPDHANITLTGAPWSDAAAIVRGSADITKQLRFALGGFSTGAVRVLTPPNADATIAGLEVAQTFTQPQTIRNNDTVQFVIDSTDALTHFALNVLANGNSAIRAIAKNTGLSSDSEASFAFYNPATGAAIGQFGFLGSTFGTTSLFCSVGLSATNFLKSSGHILVGTTAAVGTNGVRVLAVQSGTAPTTSPADLAQMWVQDFASDDARFFMRTEGGVTTQVAGLELANTWTAIQTFTLAPVFADAAGTRTALGVTATGADTAYAFRANNLSDLASASTARTNLGLTTAATTTLGTSGATIPLLNTANTHSGLATFTGSVVIGAGSVGTNGVHVLVMGGSTAPTTYPANEAQVWVVDFNGTDGLANWNFAGEGANAGTFHGTLTVAQKGGTFSTDRAELSYSGNTLTINNVGGEGWAFKRGATTYLNQQNSSTDLSVGSLASFTLGASGTFDIRGASFAAFTVTNPTLRWPGGTNTVSVYYVASGVLAVGSGAAGGTGALLCSVLVEANTAGSGAPNVLTAAESRTVLTNQGATAQNYHTLPTAAAGYEFVFVVQDSDGVRVVASAGDTIRDLATVSAAAGFIQSTTVGSVIRLISINATEWFVAAKVGTWTIDS